jgi:opacity protein-like surface antigen
MYKNFKQSPSGSFQPYVNNAPYSKVIGGIAGGIKLNNYLSGELDFQYRNMEYTASGFSNDNQTINNYSILSNMYLSKSWHGLNPFVLAGVGYARNNNGNLSVVPKGPFPTIIVSGKNTNNLIWNVGLGNSIEINKHYNFDILYRYIDLGKVKTKSTPGSFRGSSQKLRANEIIMSFIYKL